MLVPIPTGLAVARRVAMARVSLKKSRCMLMLWPTSTRALAKTTTSPLISVVVSLTPRTTLSAMVALCQMSPMASTSITSTVTTARPVLEAGENVLLLSSVALK